MAATPTGRAIRERALRYSTAILRRKYERQGRSAEWFAENARLFTTTAKLGVNGSLLALARINLTREAVKDVMRRKGLIQLIGESDYDYLRRVG